MSTLMNILSTLFLSRLTPFSTIRFMDWEATNEGVHWELESKTCRAILTYSTSGRALWKTWQRWAMNWGKDIWVCVLIPGWWWLCNSKWQFFSRDNFESRTENLSWIQQWVWNELDIRASALQQQHTPPTQTMVEPTQKSKTNIQYLDQNVFVQVRHIGWNAYWVYKAEVIQLPEWRNNGPIIRKWMGYGVTNPLFRIESQPERQSAVSASSTGEDVNPMQGTIISVHQGSPGFL